MLLRDMDDKEGARLLDLASKLAAQAKKRGEQG